MDKLAYTITQLCKLDNWPFGKCKTYELIADGSLKAKKSGRNTIILVEDAQEYLQNLPSYSPINLSWMNPPV